MNALDKLRKHIKQKGLGQTFRALWKRYVFFHWELLWLERDLVSPVAPHKLRPCPPVRMMLITPQNATAFTKHFGDRVTTMAELAAEGHIGYMYVDEEGHAVGFIFTATRDYYDRHYYRCWFPVKEGEFFEFGGEVIPAYFGTSLSFDAQITLWETMAAQGCNTVVDVCEINNIQALKMHIRMGYQERGCITHVYGLFGRWRFSRETRYTNLRLESLRKPGPSVVTAPAEA